jgi:hypothetical protein
MSKTRTEIINLLFERYKSFETYLEIGVERPSENFDKINAKVKECVDPHPLGKCTYVTTSDDFFNKCDKELKYDVIFVDGMHTGEQVYKDVINSLNHLNDGGFIVMHDCNPPTEYHARTYEEFINSRGEWNGTTFRGYLKLKQELSDYTCFIVNEDWGCGIITKRKLLKNKIHKCDADNLTWTDFNNNRSNFLQLVSFNEYFDLINKSVDYVITTQMTEHYYEISKSLFKSIKKYWKGRFIVGFIDFEPKDYDGEYYLMKRSDVKSFRTNFPKNRINYVCPQAGEFIGYIPDIYDDTVIIQIDSDILMQRSFTDEELKEIIPADNQILSVYGANPPTNLYDVCKNNLSFTSVDKYEDLKKFVEFTASIIIANRKSFRKLRDSYVNEFDELTSVCQHHAGGQWLINKIAYRDFDVKIINSKYQCAEWYIQFNTAVDNNYVLYLNNEVVIFNHTKYANEINFDKFLEKHIRT